MKRNISLSLLVALLTGCAAYTPEVNYVTSPIGAEIYEVETGKFLGISPLVVTYAPTGQHYKNGCYGIKGVSAKWQSGATNMSTSTNYLCDFKKVYTIEIPYVGDENQFASDLKHEPAVVAYLQERDNAVVKQRQQQQQQQGMSDGEAIIWSSVISSVGMLTGILTAPVIIPPTQQTPTATEYYQQNYLTPAYQQTVQPPPSYTPTPIVQPIQPVPISTTSTQPIQLIPPAPPVQPIKPVQPTPVNMAPATTLITSSGCASDYECGLGLSCIKGPMQSTGQCMQKVNQFGTPQPSISDPKSALPNTQFQGQCAFDHECPIGFSCNLKLKVCMK
ncbi:hypothetical protein ACRN98_23545 [Shewanella oncorhynchi]|uniref:hypothetical protein n=1 Tax=Shewanella TaxID=22 RepID=UPI0021D9D3D0|nr:MULTISPECIES: hypothetical protein [unclassified Shewanella]MCU7965169.1 hypothetical protein [Shewanella sp. SW32]MCU7973159.1 hypothetical protein [Shewanella sp. SW29]MCU8036930.1 hypothetical protein [Shewanella sp. SM69]